MWALCSLRGIAGARGRACHFPRPAARPAILAATVGPARRALCGVTSTGDGLVHATVGGGVATLTLSDDRKRNALSTQMMTTLRDAILGFEHDAAVKVVVIRHEGKVFSSGHDLKEVILQQSTTGTTEPIFSTCSSLMLAVRGARFPVIAEVAGLATAGGCQLVAACDLAVAAETATFSTPGVKIGLFCTTPGVALARAMPAKHAMEMLLTGDALTAQQALVSGLVNKVVPAGDLRAQTAALAQRIANAPAETVRIGKKAFYEQAAMQDLPATYAFAQNVMVDNMCIPDAKEGITAFIEKRPPNWHS
jgi:enoyl-CoA hydratase/carnithine racemase